MQRTSIEQAVGHVGRHGDTDIFPFPPENHLFRDAADEAVRVVGQAHAHFETWLNADATAGVSAMAPVGYTGFRWATQLDPLWNVYFLALALELGPAIEAHRLSSDVVHSHRFAPSATDLNVFKRDGYLAFEAASRETAESHDWVVTTDIADFYPRIRHHRLENALREVDRTTDMPKRVMTLLSRWSDNNSYGLPVGGPAARLFSEVVLDRTDKLMAVEGLTFHRYADDYRLFANSRQEAHRSLTELSELLLRNEGLALSKAKTRVMSRAEFLSTVALDGDDEETTAELTPEQRSQRTRARELLGLTLRFDPYSPTAEEDYESLKEAVERIDIIDLFMMELSKPRIDPRLTRKLLRALRAAEPAAKAHICTSIVENLELLAPLIPQVLQAVRMALSDIEPDVAGEARKELARLVMDRSHLFRIGVNQAYAIRVIADDPSAAYQQELAQLFETAEPYLQRDIIIAMARWRASYWLSDKKHLYDNVHPWVKRALLMSSFTLGDEGRHWRNTIRNRLTPFDALTRDWVAGRMQQQSGWEVPL